MHVEADGARGPATESTLERFNRRLEERASGYFEASGAASVRHLRTQVRRNATIHLFDAEIGERPRRIVVKVYRGRHQAAGAADRSRSLLPDELRVLPISTSAQRGPLEHQSLSRIHRHFAGLGDPRFGSIRVFEYLPEEQALVMEHCPDRNLEDLLGRRSRLRRFFDALRIEPALRSAGAWLRRFHAIPPLPESVERAPLRSDFIASIDRFVSYLIETGRERPFLEGARDRIRASARSALPERLPLATTHGDFVPRNVLVGRGDRVTIFDSRAQWQAPVYEDIARFRVALVASDLQMATQGWMYGRAKPERCAAEFLRGYFGRAAAPLRAIRLFECQRLLAIWVATSYQEQVSRGLRKRRKAGVLKLRGRYLRRCLDSILGE